MSRIKSIRLIETMDSKGVFGRCSCAGEVLYYTDQGVRCSTCGKLYGVWSNRRRALTKRSQDLLEQTQNPFGADEEMYTDYALGTIIREEESILAVVDQKYPYRRRTATS